MKAVELLCSPSVGGFIAVMDDGSYRWATDALHLLSGGPASEWVDTRRVAKAASLNGAPSLHRPIGHDVLLNTLNQYLA